MARPEGPKRLGHASWVLELHQVCRAGQDRPFGVRQPPQQQPVRIAAAKSLAYFGKHALPALPTCIEWLKSDNVELRKAAMNAARSVANC